MTIAEQGLSLTYGANEARSFAMNNLGIQTWVMQFEIWLFPDNSALFILGGIYVFAGKGV